LCLPYRNAIHRAFAFSEKKEQNAESADSSNYGNYCSGGKSFGMIYK